jgi:alkylhydroperoxidase family enzyme
MPTLPYFPPDATLMNVYFRYPDTAKPLLALAETLLRGPSEMSPGERELLVAYICARDASTYASALHGAAATALGIAKGTLAALLDDRATGPVGDKFDAIIDYVDKLASDPGAMATADGTAVLDAGWDQKTLFEAAAIGALAAMLSRLVAAMDFAHDDADTQAAGTRLAEQGYVRLIDGLGI